MRAILTRFCLVSMLMLIAMTPTPARQSRDAGPPVLIAAATGTATLAGRLVTDSPTPAPIRRATIRLEGAAGTSTRMVGTDDDGRFVLTAVPAGTFTLSASKAGFVQTFHGSTRPGRGPGVPIAVGDGTRIDVTLRMLPGGAITGLITDARGTPMQGIAVHALDTRSGVPAVSAMTDDAGVYRIFGLPPGEYVVSALPRLGPAGGSYAIRGAIFEVTDAEAQWARAIVTGGSTTGATPPQGRPVSLAPVYYPGSLDAAAATAVKVAPGEERAGVNLSVRMVAVGSISGTIVDALGQPVSSATVSLFPRRRDRPAVLDTLLTSNALVLPRGTVTPSGFTIPGVAPSEYTIVARSGSGQRGTVGAPPPPDPLFGVVDVSADGNDQTGVVLRLLPGLKVSGSIAFDSGSLTPPGDLSAFELSLSTSGPYLGIAVAPRATVDRAGTFRFAGLPPGTYTWKAVVSSVAGAAPWVLKSAMLNGRDLADRPLESIPGTPDLEGVLITFTDRAADVSGRIIDSRNQPVTQYSIVVFAADRSFWWPGSRRVQRAHTATDGSFTVAGLPAGDYAIAAAENVEASDLADPAFLARLLASAHKFTLADGEKKKQDLSIGGR